MLTKSLLKDYQKQILKLLKPRLEEMTIELCKLAIEEFVGGKMTGNAYNGLAVGCYYQKKLICLRVSNEFLGKRPNQYMVTRSSIFKAGKIRYDNERQLSSFKGTVGYDVGYSYALAKRFLRSYNPRNNKDIVFVLLSAANYTYYVEDRYSEYKFIKGSHSVLREMGADVGDLQVGG